MEKIKQRDEAETYNELKLLGKGTYGKAYLVERKSDGAKFVMKKIDIQTMTEMQKE
jgi:serine/threonine protein kinase